MSDRILLLSADFGSGHLQAARAVAAACEALSPASTACAINLESPLLRAVTHGYMQLLNHMPSAYRRIYHAPVGDGMRGLIRLGLEQAVREEIRRFEPTRVVATHPFPATVAAYLRRTSYLQAPLSVVLTDFAPHPIWAHQGVDRYFVASDAAAERLSSMGPTPEAIYVSGIPLRPGFAVAARPERDREGPRILVMGGGLGLGPIVEAVSSLAALPDPDLNVIVVCGSNDGLRLTLSARHGRDSRISILGYATQIPELMAEADLLVTKPGGITASEALALGLPMLLLDPLPGHEEENAEWLAATGAAVVADAQTLGESALTICRTERLQRMRAAAKAVGRPDAAFAIAWSLLAATPARQALAASGAKGIG